ncbi:glycosyl transferase family 2 [[Leptolyngbya] sp. PCC 7376]|uniref:glycosyltransferase family 2 protein n=1 Tax=[Leptolyngbya] sp. PCC 7376 TaxID=111781 RepID=UPI00029EE536|nr:glycosyltransferase [[Leptolyngbya] sp. PCC 7376]AFY36963.1 glycosyl transferase family 2 [[Leptolyngbya] sp. PCC 7376]
MIYEKKKKLSIKGYELQEAQLSLLRKHSEIEVSFQCLPNPHKSTSVSKLSKLKRIFAERGARGTAVFIYQKMINKRQKVQDYQHWLEKNSFAKPDIQLAKRQIKSWELKPTFSIIVPVYNVDRKWLVKSIESVRNQIYPYWELCLADDASPKPHIKKILDSYIQKDARIKAVYRKENGNISAASNSALEIATGDYIALLDHDDTLTIDALYENAKLINKHPDADFIYSDEDKIDTQDKRCDPFFKPQWSPDYFHGCMYTCHLGVYRKTIIDEIGGFRSDYDGAQDYDLVLRVVEKTKNIYHIPKVLYSWRVIPTSTASNSDAKPWAYIAAQKALESMIERSPYPGWVEEGPRFGFFRVRRKIVDDPLVSIVIPSAGKSADIEGKTIQLLENCIDSIRKLSTYRNFEFVIVDGFNIPEKTIEAISGEDLTLLRCDQPFNLPMRINIGVKKAKGDFLLLLNDDIEVITPDWIESMLELAQQEEVGAVGAKLFFPNETIQHAGVVVLGGNPGHACYGYPHEHPGYFLSNIINRNYFAVTGACLMMRSQLYRELGGFDEYFPLNYNDVDLCLKAHQAGYRNVVTPYAQLYHYESVSRDKGLQPGEWQKFNDKWEKYFKETGDDPYYNPNLSNDGKFEIASLSA